MPHLSLNAARVALALAVSTGLATSVATTADAKTKTKTHAKASKAAKRSADLVARNIHLDFDDDGSFAVDANIANIGNRKASRSDVSFVISSDTTWDDDDDVVDTISIPKVLPGVTRSVSDDIDLDGDGDIADDDGDLYLLVCADGNEVVNEKTESNNCTSQEIASGDDESADDDSGDDSGDDVDTTDE
jgi:hypothetical protein